MIKAVRIMRAVFYFILDQIIIKRFLEWGNQDISFGDFIGLAFVTALITMAVWLSLLIIFDVLN